MALVRRCHMGANPLGGILKPCGGIDRHVDGDAFAQADEIGIAGIPGVRQDHLIARVQECGQGQQYRRGRTRGDDDVLRGNAEAVLGMIPGSDGLA